nr:hypothetical protein [Tanacetum cinerariifolium]
MPLLGPLGLNKVITFEVLCRSLQIEPAVTVLGFPRLCANKVLFIDRRAILDDMVWRHLDAAIDDPRPIVGSFNMAVVCRLSAHVIKLRDMPESVLVLSGLSHVWKNCVFMGIHDFLCLPEWTGAEVQEEPHLHDLVVGIPSLPWLNHLVALLALVSLLVMISDDDDDACVKISLVTPLRSASVIPSSGNQDSWGKGVIVDDTVALSAGVSRPRPSSGHAPSLRDVFGDAIHMDFFPFSAGPYYATYPEDGVARNCEFTREEWDAPYRLTFKVLMKEVFKDLAVYKTIVDQFILKGYEEKVANMTGFELQVSALKKQVSGLNDKLSFSDASFAKSKAKGKERKKDQYLASDEFSRIQGELISMAASAGFERGLSMHWTKDEFAIVLKKMVNFVPDAHDRLAKESLFLEPENLVRLDNVPIASDSCVSPSVAKESTVTPASKSLDVSANVDLTAFVVASEHDEEMGVSIALDDVVDLAGVGSGCVSFGPNDVMVALSAGEKVDDLTPSSVASEEATINPSRV